jgi:hypothetical protein
LEFARSDLVTLRDAALLPFHNFRLDPPDAFPPEFDRPRECTFGHVRVDRATL